MQHPDLDAGKVWNPLENERWIKSREEPKRRSITWPPLHADADRHASSRGHGHVASTCLCRSEPDRPKQWGCASERRCSRKPIWSAATPRTVGGRCQASPGQVSGRPRRYALCQSREASLLQLCDSTSNGCPLGGRGPLKCCCSPSSSQQSDTLTADRTREDTILLAVRFCSTYCAFVSCNLQQRLLKQVLFNAMQRGR